MVHHTEPILALLDRSAKISTLNIPAARASILATPLRKISKCLRGNISGTCDFAEENSSREAYRNGSHGESVQGEDPAVLSPIDSTHARYMQRPRFDGSAETCSESFSRDHSREERSETCMDVEGDRGGTIPDLF